MKRSTKIILLAILLALPVAGASASTLDPSIIIRDPLGCPAGNCTVITTNNLSFNVPSGGFGLLHFLNATGNNWTSMILTEIGVAAVNVSCTSDVFSCSVVPFGQNGAKIVLTAISGLPGLPNNTSFEILLACGSCPKRPTGLT